VLRESITNGIPRRNRPWKKIVVMVEGIYSMEGAICNLKGVVDVCKRYKAYVYVDEAHSIGALGATGRGICEYAGVDPADVDVLMGTFTKSFGGMGGYIAASSRVVEYLRRSSAGALHHNSLSPVVCEQVLTSFRIIMGEDGTDLGARKLTALRKNSNFFRKEMKRIGMHVYGDFDSPIIPVMLYYPAKVTPHHHLANYTNLLSRHRSLSLYRPLTRMLTPLLSFAPHFYATVPHRLLHSVANASRGIWQW
jgi:serine palmitoyltransferase